MFLTLGLSNIVIGLLMVLFLICSVVLILVVLIQRPQGGGLSGAFGSGAGSGQTAFGARTGDALTIATIIIFVVWLAGAVTMKFVLDPNALASAPAAEQQTEETNSPDSQDNTQTLPADNENPLGVQTPDPAQTDPAQDPDSTEGDTNLPAQDEPAAPADEPAAPADEPSALETNPAGSDGGGTAPDPGRGGL